MVGRSICVSPPGYESFSLPETSTLEYPSPTVPAAMFTSWRLATPEATNTAFTTSWYTPTLGLEADEPFITSTVVFHTASKPLDEQGGADGCGVPDEAWDDLDWDHMSDACRSVIESQCFPEPGETSLPVGDFVKECLQPVVAEDEEGVDEAWPSNHCQDSGAGCHSRGVMSHSMNHLPKGNHLLANFSISSNSTATHAIGTNLLTLNSTAAYTNGTHTLSKVLISSNSTATYPVEANVSLTKVSIPSTSMTPHARGNYSIRPAAKHGAPRRTRLF
ncbi:hypothetical protein CDD82_2724 [Ophiocordyceps australis]|uniref:Uncharacterized protein n=1 Tax=Ophiocordyceps australis TaxID=1399860 RepID=A0A2C5XUM2_9HYPO|nr:hypothetical protein CDD82_2724 [Ophiocordyceps australis]